MARNHRRDFLKQAGLAGVGFWVAGTSRADESKSANEKLNIAVIGAGGKGASDTDGCAGENIVALCDVDEKTAGKTFEKYPNAQRFQDFRKMLEERKDIDAVVVATPDHTHAPASIMAMKLGKHVYCQKPLTHSVYEARLMRETAAKQKVATQMGNQGTSNDGLRKAVEVIQSGAIGKVTEAHVWTNRPIWPQGIPRPTDAPPVPDTLNWDLWLGPAPYRPYNPAYVPFKWRGWWDFGTGALGDMACHTANMAFMALKLGYPTSIEAESPEVSPEGPPKWSTIRFEFPAREGMPAVKFTWYDGKKPGEDGKEVANGPAPELLMGQKLSGSGSLLIGDKGMLFSPNDYGAEFKLLPEADFASYKAHDPWLPRSPGHYIEWIRACKGGEPAMSNFSYAGLLTEAILLGNVALRAGKKLEWDGPNMKATNCPEAAQFVRREYREGWTL